jgi:DNA-directed RNA polymerase alpha subunit
VPSPAADIQADANITIVNPDQVICTLDKPRAFEAEIEIKTGRGYYPGEQNKKEEQAIGVIPIDSLFSPVRLVKYAVENTRVGQITDYDKLILEIWTDGRITPDDALKQSASILKHHLDVFDRVSDEVYEFENQQSEVSEEQNKLRKLLNMSVNEIELSVRAANCLNNANITTVGELAMKTEQEMLKYRNFGKKSLNEIKEKLEALGLSLGMKFDETPARYQEGSLSLRIVAALQGCGASYRIHTPKPNLILAPPAARPTLRPGLPIGNRYKTTPMRHNKHRASLGVTREHRAAMLSNMGRIPDPARPDRNYADQGEGSSSVHREGHHEGQEGCCIKGKELGAPSPAARASGCARYRGHRHPFQGEAQGVHRPRRWVHADLQAGPPSASAMLPRWPSSS